MCPTLSDKDSVLLMHAEAPRSPAAPDPKNSSASHSAILPFFHISSLSNVRQTSYKMATVECERERNNPLHAAPVLP